MTDLSPNPVRGTVPIKIDGKSYTMRLTWHGVAQVRRLYPDGYNLADPEHLAVIMSVSMQPQHPEMTPDAIMDLSPPLELAISTVSDLVNYSWWGSKTPPERKEEPEDENPQKLKATAD